MIIVLRGCPKGGHDYFYKTIEYPNKPRTRKAVSLVTKKITKILIFSGNVWLKLKRGQKLGEVTQISSFR